MEDLIQLTINHHGRSLTYAFPSKSTLPDLSQRVSSELSIPPTHQKFLISPRPGLVKPPFSSPAHASLLLSTITTCKITLLGSTAAEVASLNNSVESSKVQTQRRNDGPIKAATPARTRDWQRLHDETTYTFLQLRPLPYLPNPDRSLRFLERLRDDAGIKTSMTKHKWSVPLLTEMNPAEHTTHEGRTLGLNRNAGEVIELRLRTDAYDGYRDYKTIRKTLCHELAHNVHGEHDRNFWDLCHEIEKEVEKNDWRSGGHALTSEEFYHGANEDEVVADHGGWTGGEYLLGRGPGSSSSGSTAGDSTMSRRDILARAAEERMKKQKE